MVDALKAKKITEDKAEFLKDSAADIIELLDDPCIDDEKGPDHDDEDSEDD